MPILAASFSEFLIAHTEMDMRTPKEWFEVTVQPPVQDYLSEPTREDKADAALSEIAHFDETVFTYLRRYEPEQWGGNRDNKLGEFREELYKECTDEQCEALKVLQKAAIARKHGESDRRGPHLFATDAISPSHDGFLIGGQDGSKLSDVLECVVSFWADWIKKNPSG